MTRAWIPLQCPACGEHWEADPSEVPPPDRSFTCRHCGESFRTAEFAKTERALDILEEFHGDR